MDVYYPLVSRGDDEELRYSLRSLSMIPHDQVVIVGDLPAWVRNVIHIRSSNLRSRKWENSTAHMEAVCRFPGLSEEFIYMNDDFYILRPMDRIPVLHRGTVEKVASEYKMSSIRRGMEDTAEWLRSRGYGCVNSYELHVPMALNKYVMSNVLNGVPSHIRAFTKRTAYGMIKGIGGVCVPDPIFRDMNGIPRPNQRFAASTDETWDRGRIGQYVRERFPDPSPYEENYYG